LLGAVSLDKILSEDRLEKAFKIFDLNKDNQISFSEIKTVLQDVREIDDATIEKVLKSIGKNEGRNSNLNFKEFKQFIKQLFK
jgi:Ca2+-binding EF-hand superfamily protein